MRNPGLSARARGECLDERYHQCTGVAFFHGHVDVLINAVEVNAVEPGFDNALEVTILAPEDDLLPAFLPVAHAVVSRPFRVFAAEPAGREHAEEPAPVPFPIVPVRLRFPDREIGKRDAPPAVGLDPDPVDLFRRPRQRGLAVARIVDHQHVVRCGGQRVGIELLQLIAPTLGRGQQVRCWIWLPFGGRLRECRKCEEESACKQHQREQYGGAPGRGHFGRRHWPSDSTDVCGCRA